MPSHGIRPNPVLSQVPPAAHSFMIVSASWCSALPSSVAANSTNASSMTRSGRTSRSATLITVDFRTGPPRAGGRPDRLQLNRRQRGGRLVGLGRGQDRPHFLLERAPVPPSALPQRRDQPACLACTGLMPDDVRPDHDGDRMPAPRNRDFLLRVLTLAMMAGQGPGPWPAITSPAWSGSRSNRIPEPAVVNGPGDEGRHDLAVTGRRQFHLGA